MKITPKEMQDVLDYIEKTPMSDQTFAKMVVLDRLLNYYSELPEEEKENFPDEVIADLRYSDLSTTVKHFADEGDIDSLKSFVDEELCTSNYRTAPPFYRAKYAWLSAVGCMFILENTPKGYEAEQDLWIYRGLESVNLAIELYSRMEDDDNVSNALSLKAQILKNKSLKEAAACALSGIRFAPTDEWRNEFVELWSEITDERFDRYFAPKELSFINQLPLPEHTLEELCSKDSNIAKIAETCLCSVEPNYDRSPILFVEKIEDVAKPEVGELAEVARYVFCLDRIPSELHFDDGHPKANTLYVVDEEDTTLYHYHEDQEKEGE